MSRRTTDLILDVLGVLLVAGGILGIILAFFILFFTPGF